MLKIILNFIFYTLSILSGITCAIIAAYTESDNACACLLLVSMFTIIGGFIGYLINNDK